jgi:deoxyribose-phosphate aldolase
MTDAEIFSKIDHTLLKMTASMEEIKILCDEAVKFNTASVCIPPCYVKPVSDLYPKLNICTVIGFPLGYSITAAKILEAERAIPSGANEIDMVINVSDVKNGNFNYVLEEIKLVKKVCDNKILKVIIETCYLSAEEKIRLCEVVTESGADFIKTSTGFGTAGASLTDIELFKKHIGSNVRIKAAGGVKTREDMEAFINAGAQRIGTSSGIKILTGAGARDTTLQNAEKY